jgi:maltooligosyltrehalose trehalohydrolase
MHEHKERRLPGGAESTPDGVRFRVWAPRASKVDVVFQADSLPDLPLEPEAYGYFSGTSAHARAGALYRYRLDDAHSYPDPYSRFQPQGPHGPSQVVDADAFSWHDAAWRGIEIAGQVLYELHIGAFTQEGTFDAAARQLPHLADLGITCVEIMPVAEFPGQFNWGYDAVDLYAPFHGYGEVDAFRRFVNAAHALGLGVILDVVYNHFGADGNYLACFSTDYFTDRYPNEWGDAINFDGANSGPVRELFVENAAYWIREFHLDGLRLDATQSLYDATRPHITAAIAERARAEGGSRKIVLIAENEPQRAELLWPPEEGGMGVDAIWNDDFHHSARVALTGSRDGYFHDYLGRSQELASAVKYGFLFQGQYYCWQDKSRGTPALDREAWSFVTYLQNHDQVANTFYGQRLHELTSPGRHRAMTALLLLAPQTPMLFMGQEFNASTPFAFFADHKPELAAKVWSGRRQFMRQFARYAAPEAQARLPDPSLARTFEDSKLDFTERDSHAGTYKLHRDLLRLRREDPVISAQRRQALDCAVLSERALVVRWFDVRNGDRLLLVNLGDDLSLRPAPEPLLAPPSAARWDLAWSSEDPGYGGTGAIASCDSVFEGMPAGSAVLLRATANRSSTLA